MNSAPDNSQRFTPNAYLFRSALLGAVVMIIGTIIFDPNRDAPDYAASMVFGLIGLPVTIAMLLIPIVVLLRFVFQPLSGFLLRKGSSSAANVLIAALSVVLPTVVLVQFIEGAVFAHAVTAGLAMAASCLMYARMNRLA